MRSRPLFITAILLMTLAILLPSQSAATITVSSMTHTQDFKDGDTLTITAVVESDVAIEKVKIFFCQGESCHIGEMRSTGGDNYEFTITHSSGTGGDSTYSDSSDLKYRISVEGSDGSSEDYPSDDKNEYLHVDLASVGDDGGDDDGDSPGFEGAALIGIMLILTIVASKSANRFRGK